MENKLFYYDRFWFFGVEISEYATDKKLLKEFISKSILNPFYPVCEIRLTLDDIFNGDFNCDEISNLVLQYENSLKSIDFHHLSYETANNLMAHIEDWEKNIGTLSRDDWKFLFDICPEIRSRYAWKEPLTPLKLADIVSEQVKGQEEAVASLCFYLYEFLCYWSAINDANKTYPRPANSRLLIGETGSGKTFLVNTIAKAIGVAVIKIDASKLVSEGYFGMKLYTEIIQQYESLPDEMKAVGKVIVFIDEFDKLSSRFSDDFKGTAVLNEALYLLDEKQLIYEVLTAIINLKQM